MTEQNKKKLILNKNTAKTLKINTEVKTGQFSQSGSSGSGGLSVSVVVSRVQTDDGVAAC